MTMSDMSHGAETTQSTITGCPSSASISPCACATVTMYNLMTGLSINCNSQNLTDSQLSNILNVVLSPTIISPILSLSASQNKLTYAPNQIPNLMSLSSLDLSFNQIANISSLGFGSFSVAISLNINLNNPS